MTSSSEPWRPDSPPLPGQDPSGHDQRPKHETTDASAGSTLASGVGLLLLVVFAAAASYGIYRHDARMTADSRSPANPQTSEQLPPEPRLQAQPRSALDVLRSVEDERLTHYRRLDDKSGRVQIPIDRAIELLSERGFPVPTATATSTKRETPR
jgi:hypothetical protein